MPALQTLAALLPVSLTAGINLYATVLMLGLSARIGWVTNMPEGFEHVGSWWIIGVAAVFYLLEFFADKIQFIDNLWDLVHTFIRPLGMGFLAFAVLGDANPVVAFLAALAAGSIALVSHGGKAGVRAVVNVTSPAENVSNVAISVTEDVGVAVLTLIAMRYWWLGAIIAIIVLALIIVLLPRLLRWAWFTVRAVIARLRGLVRKVKEWDVLPVDHLVFMRHRKPGATIMCKAQGIKGAAGRTGYISVLGRSLLFTYNTLFGVRHWRLRLPEVDATYLRHRLLMDVVEVHYRDKYKPRAVRFAVTKDRTLLSEKLASALGEFRAAQA